MSQMRSVSASMSPEERWADRRRWAKSGFSFVFQGAHETVSADQLEDVSGRLKSKIRRAAVRGDDRQPALEPVRAFWKALGGGQNAVYHHQTIVAGVLKRLTRSGKGRSSALSSRQLGLDRPAPTASTHKSDAWSTEREVDESELAVQIPGTVDPFADGRPLFSTFSVLRLDPGLDTVIKRDADLRPMFNRGKSGREPGREHIDKGSNRAIPTHCGLHGRGSRVSQRDEAWRLLLLQPEKRRLSGIIKTAPNRRRRILSTMRYRWASVRKGSEGAARTD